jgi:hypothetical protein
MSQYLASTIHGSKEFFVTSSVLVPLVVLKKKKTRQGTMTFEVRTKKIIASNDRSF